jgi:hypothetical protein
MRSGFGLQGSALCPELRCGDELMGRTCKKGANVCRKRVCMYVCVCVCVCVCNHVQVCALNGAVTHVLTHFFEDELNGLVDILSTH